MPLFWTRRGYMGVELLRTIVVSVLTERHSYHSEQDLYLGDSGIVLGIIIRE